jgi:ABC-2 type transport system permease protein
MKVVRLLYESFLEESKKLKTDRMILLIALIIPIIVNLLVGWELSKGVMDYIPLGVVDEDNSPLSRQLIQYFADNETFALTYYAQNQEELQELISQSKIKAGLVIPSHFSEDVTSLRSPSVLMIYDGSHMSITSVAKAKASEILLTMRTGAAIKQLEGRLLMTEDEAYQTAMPIAFETRTLYNPAKNFNYFMTPGYGTIICQTGIGLTAVLCITSMPKRKKQDILHYISGKVLFYGGLGSIAFIINILVQVLLFKIPCRGFLVIAFFFSILLAMAVAAMAVAVSAWMPKRTIAIAAIGLLLLPNSVMAGYTWPLISMSAFYQKTAYLIPFYHYGDNIRDLFLKGSMQHPLSDILFFLVFILAMVWVAASKFFFAQPLLTKEEKPL